MAATMKIARYNVLVDLVFCTDETFGPEISEIESCFIGVRSLCLCGVRVGRAEWVNVGKRVWLSVSCTLGVAVGLLVGA